MPMPGRVLVLAGADGGDGGLEHLGGPVFVGEALPEVDGAGAHGQGAHLGEDRRGARCRRRRGDRRRARPAATTVDRHGILSSRDPTLRPYSRRTASDTLWRVIDRRKVVHSIAQIERPGSRPKLSVLGRSNTMTDTPNHPGAREAPARRRHRVGRGCCRRFRAPPTAATPAPETPAARSRRAEQPTCRSSRRRRSRPPSSRPRGSRPLAAVAARRPAHAADPAGAAAAVRRSPTRQPYGQQQPHYGNGSFGQPAGYGQRPTPHSRSRTRPQPCATATGVPRGKPAKTRQHRPHHRDPRHRRPDRRRRRRRRRRRHLRRDRCGQRDHQDRLRPAEHHRQRRRTTRRTVTAVAAKASPSVVTISVSASSSGGTGSGIILTLGRLRPHQHARRDPRRRRPPTSPSRSRTTTARSTRPRSSAPTRRPTSP